MCKLFVLGLQLWFKLLHQSFRVLGRQLYFEANGVKGSSFRLGVVACSVGLCGSKGFQGKE